MSATATSILQVLRVMQLLLIKEVVVIKFSDNGCESL